MDLKPGTYLTAPNIKNVSCTHPRYTQPLYHYIGPFDVVQALIILSITIGIIGANLMLVFVINHRRYSPYIHPLVNTNFSFNFPTNRRPKKKNENKLITGGIGPK